MATTGELRWRDATGSGLEHCRLARSAGRTEVTAVVISPAGPPAFACRYRIVCDAAWRVREAEVEVLGAEAPLVLVSDGDGRWTDGAGRQVPALAGAIDVDISATPFTNTLPVRRLGLAIGTTAAIEVAYIEVPSLALARRPQRYTRLGPALYRFETLDHIFEREISVDDEGLVTDYPGLFARVF